MAEEEKPEEEKTSSLASNGSMNLAIMGILGSLIGYVFYGHIQLEATVSVHDIQMEQGISERKDLWGKYNDAGDMFGDFIVKDANDKAEIRLEIKDVQLHSKDVELKTTARWMEYWKEKAQEK